MMTFRKLAAASAGKLLRAPWMSPDVSPFVQALSSMQVAARAVGLVNLTEEQLGDFNALPPILANPSPSAAHVGVGSATMIVKNPPQVVNGYEAILHLNGKPGWIQADKLVPWKNASDPRTRCIPSIMSNGRPGFDYGRLR
jgi:hypothetical protein